MTTAIGNSKLLARVEEAWRHLAGTAFLMPPAVDSARYAIMEGAEADDANMREERNTDARNNDRNMDARKEWGQAGFMVLTAVMQVKANSGGLVLAENYPTFKQDLPWLYGAFMGCLSNFVQEVATNHPFAKSGQSLAFAWLYWRQYAEQRDWHPADLIDETCRAFEAKHIPGWGVSEEHRSLALLIRRVLHGEFPHSAPAAIRGMLVAELEAVLHFTADEAERAARWAMLEPLPSLEVSERASLESDSSESPASDSSETAQHDLPVVSRSTA